MSLDSIRIDSLVPPNRRSGRASRSGSRSTAPGSTRAKGADTKHEGIALLDAIERVEPTWKPDTRLKVQVETEETVQATEPAINVYPTIKRLIDIVGALVLLAILSPVILAFAARIALRNRGQVLERTIVAGRNDIPFVRYMFRSERRFMRKIPVLFNILKGDMAFIGPRAYLLADLEAVYATEPGARARGRVRPGLLCSWWIRRRVSLDYVREIALDLEYVCDMSFAHDCSIFMRALPGIVTVALWGDDPESYDPQIDILGVTIDNVSMDDAIDRIEGMLEGGAARQACFINPHNLNESVRVPEYKAVLDSSVMVLADGFGSKLAGNILKRPLLQNLCGTDLFPRLCARIENTDKGIYLLGAEPGAADRVADWALERYPNLDIRGTDHGYFSEDEEAAVVERINASGADMLIVAMGVPRQELWIQKHLDSLDVKVAMGFGGLFDYFAGNVPRAPRWVREMGMEWVYRLIQEPTRLWRRYLVGNFKFLVRVMRQRMQERRRASIGATADDSASERQPTKR